MDEKQIECHNECCGLFRFRAGLSENNLVQGARIMLYPLKFKKVLKREFGVVSPL